MHVALFHSILILIALLTTAPGHQVESTNDLWTQFTTIENFHLAWERTVRVTNRMLQDTLGMRVFAYNLTENLEELREDITSDEEQYQPTLDHKIYVPKPSTTLRTMSMLCPRDLVVYQALVNVIADRSYKLLATNDYQHVFGNIYAGPDSKWMLKRYPRLYNKFLNKIKSFYTSGNRWIASTDIVAFYDSVDHERLRNQISQYCGNDERFLALFSKCLSTWATHRENATMGRGIPQGSNASDYLANLFLYELDCALIRAGYHYVRYADDIRILGIEKSEVQKGLILFDRELKNVGLVAQVSKTSVHEIMDIEQEIHRLKFMVTDSVGDGYISRLFISEPRSEQASVTDFIANTPGLLVLDQSANADSFTSGLADEITDDEMEEDEEDTVANADEQMEFAPSENDSNSRRFQTDLLAEFKKSLELLGNAEKGKEAESNLIFCLKSMGKHDEIRTDVIDLLEKLPWRSEAVTQYLSGFKKDSLVATGLRTFLVRHDVYEWHCANVLWALSQVSGAKAVADICREWLTNRRLDWHSRTIAARILSEVPGQYSFLLECLRVEQSEAMAQSNTEATALLRAELAHSAFVRLRSHLKQQGIFQVICREKESPVLRRLAVYLFQQPSCSFSLGNSEELKGELQDVSSLLSRLGLASDIELPCFISKKLREIYGVENRVDLRGFYGDRYTIAVYHLRKALMYFHLNDHEQYVEEFHKFADLTMIRFHEVVLKKKDVLAQGFYDRVSHKDFKAKLPIYGRFWSEILNPLRVRAAHVVNNTTKQYTEKITSREAQNLHKALSGALSEIVQVIGQS